MTRLELTDADLAAIEDALLSALADNGCDSPEGAATAVAYAKVRNAMGLRPRVTASEMVAMGNAAHAAWSDTLAKDPTQ